MKKWRLLFALGAAALFSVFIPVSNGNWNLRQHFAKATLLEALRFSMTSKPLQLQSSEITRLTIVDAGTIAKETTSIPEFSLVEITGHFMQIRGYPAEALRGAIFNRGNSQLTGHFWLSPFQTEKGPIVFINRGFMPVKPDKPIVEIDPHQGIQTISGFIRRPGNSRILSSNVPHIGFYSERSINVMTVQTAFLNTTGHEPFGREIANFVIDLQLNDLDSEKPPTGLDARELIRSLPNNHFIYGIAWYCLALFSFLLLGNLAYKDIRRQANISRNPKPTQLS